MHHGLVSLHRPPPLLDTSGALAQRINVRQVRPRHHFDMHMVFAYGQFAVSGLRRCRTFTAGDLALHACSLVSRLRNLESAGSISTSTYPRHPVILFLTTVTRRRFWDS